MENKSDSQAIPNFQRDVIIPQIYDLQNIKLIQSCSYPQSPTNPVKQLRKQQIGKVIQSIINKPKPQIRPPSPTAKHNKYGSGVRARPKTAKEPSNRFQINRQSVYQSLLGQTVSQKQGEQLQIALDERLGQLILSMQDNYSSTHQRITSVLQKVKCFLNDKQLKLRKEEVSRYMNVASQGSTSRKFTIGQITPVKGMLQEIQQMQRKTTKIKKRAQSAAPKRSFQKTQEFFVRQNRQRTADRPLSTLHAKQTITLQKDKSRQIIRSINSYFQQQEREKQMFERKLGTMKGEWGEKSQIRKTFSRTDFNKITASTLEILRDKRLKDKAMKNIDKQIFAD